MIGYTMGLTDDKPLTNIKTTVFSNDDYRFTN